MNSEPPEYQPDWVAVLTGLITTAVGALASLLVLLPKLLKARSDARAADSERRIKDGRARIKDDQDRVRLDQAQADFAIKTRERMFEDAYAKMMEMADREQDCRIRLATANTLLEETRKDLTEVKDRMREALAAKDAQIAELKGELLRHTERLRVLESRFGSDPDKKAQPK